MPSSFFVCVHQAVWRRAHCSGADFLALEHDVPDDEENDRSGHQADDLRPYDQDALQQRNWRVGNASPLAASIDCWVERTEGSSTTATISLNNTLGESRANI